MISADESWIMVFKIILQVIIRIIPEPFTPEPVESYSKDDIDEFVDAYRQIAEEAYTTPQVVKKHRIMRHSDPESRKMVLPSGKNLQQHGVHI